MLLTSCSAVPLVRGKRSASHFCAQVLQSGPEINAAPSTCCGYTSTESGRSKVVMNIYWRRKIPQLSVSDKLTKGVFKYSDSEIKNSSSLPLTTEQWLSLNNSDNARSAGTSFPFLLLPFLSLHCTLPVFPLCILPNFCFSLKIPGQNYWEGNITVLFYRE